jgi:hypothetical protein
LERGYYGAWLAICVDGVGGFCVGDSGLFDGGMKHFGGEDYWCSSLVGYGGNVHNTRHIHECMRHLESKSHNPLTNLLFFFFYSFLSRVGWVNF